MREREKQRKRKIKREKEKERKRERERVCVYVRERARARDRESSRPSILWVRPHIYCVYIHVRVYTHFCIDVYTAAEASL